MSISEEIADSVFKAKTDSHLLNAQRHSQEFRNLHRHRRYNFILKLRTWFFCDSFSVTKFFIL
jgi:hypothetical protein